MPDEKLQTLQITDVTEDSVPAALARIAKGAGKCAVAFSGGVDSAYLLFALMRCGADAKAYLARTAFTPSFEISDAVAFAEETGAELEIVDIDVFDDENIMINSALRCYYCKRRMLSALIAAARADGRDMLFDGTNASDDDASRPGSRALAELGVRSPLREAAMSKDDIRRAAKRAGLALWDKPSYSCLATRIEKGIRPERDLLEKVERAEAFMAQKAFSDFRVRVRRDGICVQVRRRDFPLLDAHREETERMLANLFPRLEITFAERV